MSSEQKSLIESQQLKSQEVQIQQAKLKDLQTDLEKLNAKIHKHETLSAEDTKFISDLGWLSALSVTIASVAATL